MKFIKTDDEEVLDMLATKSSQLRKAVGVLKELSADEQTRILFEKREMARRDFKSQLEVKDAVIANKDLRIAELEAQLVKYIDI
jgi:hypothetical protein